MTNKEKYKDVIYSILVTGGELALKDDIPCRCSSIRDCDECDFNDALFCDKAINEWLNAEYKEK